MKATPQQRAICDSPAQVLRVSAFAGTGKTTTLQGYAANHRNERILYLAFNKGIQQQAKLKFARQRQVRPSTIHGIAFAEIGKDYAALPNKLATGDLKPFQISKYLGQSFRVIPPHVRNLYAARVLETIKTYLVSADLDMHDAHVTIGASTVERSLFRPERILSDAYAIWDRMTSLRPGSLPITHDGYLKLFHRAQLTLPYDIFLLDEAQDTNPVTQAIVEAQPGRKVYVGDEHQAIYAFRGARNAMALIDADESLYLTGSFRFGPAIARVANALLSGKGETVPLEGLGQDSEVGYIDYRRPYAYLARSNSAIFARAIQAIHRNEPFALVGALYSYRFDLIEQTYLLMTQQKVTDPFLRSFASYEELEAYGEAMKDREVLSRCRIVAKYGAQIPALVRKISQSARSYPSPEAKLVLATAHRAKGLEFDQVLLADDFLDFRDDQGHWRDLARLDLHDTEELNLQYVAVTRAKHRLQVGDRLSDYLLMRAAQAEGLADEAPPLLTASEGPAVVPSSLFSVPSSP